MVAKTKKKEYEYIRIISLDGSGFFGETNPSAFRNGKLNKDFFSGVLDDSLDTKQLLRIYGKHRSEIKYPCVTKDGLCRAIVSV